MAGAVTGAGDGCFAVGVARGPVIVCSTDTLMQQSVAIITGVARPLQPSMPERLTGATVLARPATQRCLRRVTMLVYESVAVMFRARARLWQSIVWWARRRCCCSCLA
jgi:hypothetical protein